MYININEILLKKFRKDRGSATRYGSVAVHKKVWSRLVQVSPDNLTRLQSSPVWSAVFLQS